MSSPLTWSHFLQFVTGGYSRSQPSLQKLVDTIEIVAQGSDFVLQSTDDYLSKIKKRPTGAELEEMMKNPIGGNNQSLNELIVQGLVELCRVKPVGNDAVKWLGEWFLANNPNKPNVIDPDE